MLAKCFHVREVVRLRQSDCLSTSCKRLGNVAATLQPLGQAVPCVCRLRVLLRIEPERGDGQF